MYKFSLIVNLSLSITHACLTVSGLQWGHLEEGCMVHWAQKSHTEWQEKGAEQSVGHERREGTTLTVIICCYWFHWLAPFSGWSCIIRGNQLLLCCLGMKHCRLQLRWLGSTGLCDGFLYLHLFLSPHHQDQALISSPSGNTERERTSALAKYRNVQLWGHI